MTDFIDKNIYSEGSSSSPMVAILLCTYNGARFLSEQLDSLQAQTHQNWVVFASDDASTDQTVEILKQYRAKWPAGKLTIRNGPQKGFCRNFMSLVADNSILADFYAFCDQDDVWLPEKLSRSLDALRGIPAQTPAVYGSRTQLIDERGLFVGMSPFFALTPSFENALVQSIAGGNTMVLNHAAKLAIQIEPQHEIVSHDWWAYLVITGMGGQFLYDPIPTTYYRQHKANIIGGKKGVFKKFSRLNSLLSGNLQKWIEARGAGLYSVANKLTPQNQLIFRQFCKLRKSSILTRVLGMRRLGIHRQHFSENVTFYFAVILNKI